jgi:ribosome recycling factor
MLSHCKDKKISELTEHQREKLSKDYAKLVENHQMELRNFALKFNLTLIEFQNLVKKFNKKQAR